MSALPTLKEFCNQKSQNNLGKCLVLENEKVSFVFLDQNFMSKVFLGLARFLHERKESKGSKEFADFQVFH